MERKTVGGQKMERDAVGSQTESKPNAVDFEGAAAEARRRKGGRPPKLVQASRKQIYLDDPSVRIAIDLGKGNLSEGVREALRRAAGGAT